MKNNYKTVILKNSIINVIEAVKEIQNDISEEGSLFCIVKNSYKNDEIKNDIFDVMEYCTNIGLTYINTIICPQNTKLHYDNIQYIIWFVKNKEKMYFNKDAIREKHIWKDVEWGKREKNYNPKGKDPGNVWIPTLDDGKGKITKHILLNNNEIYNRILSSTIETKSDNIFILSSKKEDSKYKYKDNNITFKFVENTETEDIKNLSNKNKENQNIEIENTEKNTKETYKAKVFFGTSENMEKVHNNTVKLIVTSPPYWDLKDYFKENQIGKEDYETYSKRMYQVWQECFNKLKDNGSMWININVRVRNNKPIYLPKLFIEQCKKIGFKFKEILIWHKSSGIPTNAKNIVDRHEYVLIFTKGKQDELKSFKCDEFSDYKNDELNGGLIWNINRKAGSVGKKTIHPAIYPTELINRIIKISTHKGDIVLDPFLGSGTSLIAALNNTRNFVGYEFNEGFRELMISRFKKEIYDYKEDEVKFLNLEKSK